MVKTFQVSKTIIVMKTATIKTSNDAYCVDDNMKM